MEPQRRSRLTIRRMLVGIALIAGGLALMMQSYRAEVSINRAERARAIAAQEAARARMLQLKQGLQAQSAPATSPDGVQAETEQTAALKQRIRELEDEVQLLRRELTRDPAARP